MGQVFFIYIELFAFYIELTQWAQKFKKIYIRWDTWWKIKL